jgi:hypothetical protein
MEKVSVPVIYAGLKQRKREMMKKSVAPKKPMVKMAKGGAVKKPVKKYAMGGMLGELPTMTAAQQQANAAEVAKNDALQQQYMQQQRQQQRQQQAAQQQQQMAASDPRARATAGRARTQRMMAKGGAVKKGAKK